MNYKVKTKMSNVFLKNRVSNALEFSFLNSEMEKNSVTYLYSSLNINHLKGLSNFSRAKTKFFLSFINRNSSSQNQLILKDSKGETHLKLIYPLSVLNVKHEEYFTGQSAFSVLILLKPYFFKKQYAKSYSLTHKNIFLKFLIASN